MSTTLKHSVDRVKFGAYSQVRLKHLDLAVCEGQCSSGKVSDGTQYCGGLSSHLSTQSLNLAVCGSWC